MRLKIEPLKFTKSKLVINSFSDTPKTISRRISRPTYQVRSDVLKRTSIHAKAYDLIATRSLPNHFEGAVNPGIANNLDKMTQLKNRMNSVFNEVGMIHSKRTPIAIDVRGQKKIFNTHFIVDKQFLETQLNNTANPAIRKTITRNLDTAAKNYKSYLFENLYSSAESLPSISFNPRTKMMELRQPR